MNLGNEVSSIIGISEENHASIFDPFTQADGGAAREHGGIGLGLAIAKRLVEMMGGRIWLESTHGNHRAPLSGRV